LFTAEEFGHIDRDAPAGREVAAPGLPLADLDLGDGVDRPMADRQMHAEVVTVADRDALASTAHPLLRHSSVELPLAPRPEPCCRRWRATRPRAAPRR